MLNFSFISLLSFVLVYQNIIILNEESLILICFITFCWIIFNKLGNFIFNDLNNQAIKIENSLINSLNSLLKELLITIKFKNKFKNIAISFKILGDHFLKYGYAISNKLPFYINQNQNNIYKKKLIFTYRLEQQSTKLLALLLNYKLNKITNTQKFFIYNLQLPHFICINNIILREYLEII
uniref:Ymf39 n=1 Tax=Cystoclonium purpureum f. stellatum TaxID=3024809 RepID=UPI0023F246A8|nr:Ymf39 [Cystoclonium purpureum f. stellatum]WDY85180.1 Ymf39 [Cystoclonium purpureum f. stellatum]